MYIFILYIFIYIYLYTKYPQTRIPNSTDRLLQRRPDIQARSILIETLDANH